MARILVVDDDRTIRRSLGQRLMETGYGVMLAEGTRAAQQLLKTEAFDAALVDIHLKDGDGLALLEEIRKDTPLLPVIMVTAYGDSDRTIRAMKSGAFEYVTKPFELDALLATIARAVQIRPPAQLPPAAASTGTLVGASPAMLTGVAAAEPEHSLDLRKNIEQLTRRLIETALERSGGNRAQAARLLGIRRVLLYERMLQFGMRGAD